MGRRRGRELVCDPVTALAWLGVDRDAVTDIILTHFHCDHIGNVARFLAAQLVAGP